jgi:hypothetical protein
MTGNKYVVMMRAVLVAAILAGMSGVAGAQENSMSRFGGESSAYFNQPTSKAPADQAWRLSQPNGLTQSELQARVDGVFAQRAHEPVFSKVADDPAWRASHRDGLSDPELQALSSEAPAWHGADKSITGALASRSTRSGPGSAKGELPLSIRGGDEDHDRKEPAVGSD